MHETTTFLLVTCQIVADLKKNLSTDRLSNKHFSIWLSTTPPHLKHVAKLPCNYFIVTRLFSDINVSQGSVATYARSGGIYNNQLAVNLQRNLLVKRSWKSVKFWQNYGGVCHGHVFGAPCRPGVESIDRPLSGSRAVTRLCVVATATSTSQPSARVWVWVVEGLSIASLRPVANIEKSLSSNYHPVTSCTHTRRSKANCRCRLLRWRCIICIPCVPTNVHLFIFWITLVKNCL